MSKTHRKRPHERLSGGLHVHQHTDRATLGADPVRMNDTTPLLPESYFHEDSGAVRFWVRSSSGDVVGASIHQETLHHRYQAVVNSGAGALSTYHAHRGEIDAAVKRRIARGSIEPVILREHDLAKLPVC